MFILYQIVVFFTFWLIVSTKIKKRAYRFLLAAVSSSTLTLEIASVYITGRFVDYRFWSHANFRSLESYGFQFTIYFACFFALLLACFFIFYYLPSWVNSKISSKNVLKPIFLVVIVSLVVPGGVFNELFQLVKVITVKEMNFKDALNSVGIPPEKYVTPDRLVAQKGKNIVVISLESLEKGFLGEQFPGLAPNLNALSKKWTSYNMSHLKGCSWTAASLYAHQVGIPAFFKAQGNDIFQRVIDVKLTGLGHIFKKSGYDTRYLVGNPDFAGMSDLLNAYGIHVISEKNCLGNYARGLSWGMHDLDLFQEAKLQIEKLRKSEKPFALFLSTINTHYPDGICDKRMRRFVDKKTSNLEFSVAATDYLIADFIQYLNDTNLLNNTAVYIFPDHLLMGQGGLVHAKLRKSERMLYLLTNVGEEHFPYQRSDLLYQTDLPRMIVDGAGISTNAKFLCDFVVHDNTIDFINKNIQTLTGLNTASLAVQNFLHGLNVDIQGEDLVLESEKGSKERILVSQNMILDVVFNSQMKFIKSKKCTVKNFFSYSKFDDKFNRIHLIVFLKNGELSKAYLGNKLDTGFYKLGEKVSFTESEISLVINSNLLKEANKIKQKEVNRKKKDNNILYDPMVVKVTSSDYNTSRYTPSKVNVGGRTFFLKRGLNILTINDIGEFGIESFDTWENGGEAQKFLLRIKDLINSRKFWAIAVHDAIKTTYPDFKEELSKLNFEVLPSLNGRTAYIAYPSIQGALKEFSSKETISLVIPSYQGVLHSNYNYSKNNDSQASFVPKEDGRAVKRFIAHAGGEVGGTLYTNSLEALNLNYKRGFRYFELDMIKTSDNHYVAAHDWNHWAKITGYKGNFPPSRDRFMQQKIYKKYTPLDMGLINAWFKEHSDAILVTDKVNNPEEFCTTFVDKDRLMMELFTWDAVKLAMDAGIKSSMPTWELLAKIQGDIVSYLKDLGVTDIACSQRILKNQKRLMSKIIQAGIHLNAFHINFDGVNEKDIVCGEGRKYFYGIYADRWFSNISLSPCNESLPMKKNDN